VIQGHRRPIRTVEIRSTTSKIGLVFTQSPNEMEITERVTRGATGVISAAMGGAGPAVLLGPDRSQNIGVIGVAARRDGGAG
jgi:hypothetical protein